MHENDIFVLCIMVIRIWRENVPNGYGNEMPHCINVHINIIQYIDHEIDQTESTYLWRQNDHPFWEFRAGTDNVSNKSSPSAHARSHNRISWEMSALCNTHISIKARLHVRDT